MSNVVADTNHIFPRYLWTIGQKFPICDFIYLANTLTYCFYEHTTGCKLLHPIR